MAREYRAVLSQMSTITDHLKLNKAAKDSLTIKYQEKKWLGIAEHPEPKELVTLVLGRIANGPEQYRVFMDMLNGIAGMDLIVKGFVLPAAAASVGTKSRILGINDLQGVYSKVIGMATKWREIGLSLGLLDAQLATVAADNNDKVQSCLRDMLSLWLRRTYDVDSNGPPTMAGLAAAVRDPAGGNDLALADKL